MEKYVVEEGFKKFRSKVIIFAVSIALAIDVLAFIQMGIL
jgi:hypothetical protein